LNIKNKKNFKQVINCVERLENTEYLSEKWYDLIDNLNGLIYETYNLNSEQRNFIELAMKERLSSRWYKNGK
jgi:hypothetical protein